MTPRWLDQFELAHLDLRVHGVWLIAGLVLLSALAARRRARALTAFGVDPHEGRGLGRRRALSRALLATGLLACLGASLGPRANPQREVIETRARDLAVCLDVSRSMLADDLKPSRLEHAKLELTRLAEHLGNERVGLVLFAGEAVVRCPLTSNTSYFQTALRNVSPASVGQGGTHVGDAIRKALADLLGHDLSGRASQAAAEAEPGGPPALALEALESYQDILVITDGEDHDSYPVPAARLARQLGVGVFAVGLGSAEGQLIPLAGEGASGYVEYQGAPVKSALNESLLTQTVNAAGRGKYLPVGTQHFDLVDFYERAIKADDGRVTEEELLVWTEVYQPFLILGLLLILLSRAVPLGRLRIGPSAARAASAGVALALALGMASPAQAQDPGADGEPPSLGTTEDAAPPLPAREAFARGNEAYRAGDLSGAIARYEAHAPPGPQSSETAALLCRFNAAVAHCALGQYEAAIEHLEAVSVQARGPLQAEATYLLGSAHHALGLALTEAPAPGDDGQPETPEQALERLGKAAVQLRGALDFFRRVRPRGAREEQALQVTTLRLRQVQDALHTQADALAEAERQAALADPSAFLLESLGRVRGTRRALVAMAKLRTRQRLVPARRLAKDEAAWRELIERLAFGLQQPPQPPAPGSPAPEPQQTEREQQAREAAAEALSQVVSASRQLEGALRGLAPDAALDPAHAEVEALRLALLAQPLDLAALTAELVQAQAEVVSRLDDPDLIAREEDEVAFLCQVFPGVQAQAAPPAAPGQPPAAGLSEEAAAEIRRLGGQAHDDARQAFVQLEQDTRTEARAPAERALEALRRIQELLPKPPPSLQQRIQELLKREREARAETDALDGLSEEARAQERQRLEQAQREHAQTARALGQEAQQVPESGEEVAGHLEDAARGAEDAAGALATDQRQPALDHTDRAIEALKRALEALQGDESNEQQNQQDQQDSQDSQEPQEPQEPQDPSAAEEPRKLDPEEARRLMEQQDAERREEEARLFRSGGRAVERDW